MLTIRHSSICFCAILTLYLFPCAMQAQSESADPVFEAGLEFQAYPTGLLPGIRFGLPITDKGLFELRLGYNYVRHRDLGLHDDERGDGFGFTVGYRYFLQEDLRGWNFGLRSDLWFNTVEWRDTEGTFTARGESEVIVLQPTGIVGYSFNLGGGFTLSPGIGFGVEINIHTEGEKVGEGLIGLVGFSLSRYFGSR